MTPEQKKAIEEACAKSWEKTANEYSNRKEGINPTAYRFGFLDAWKQRDEEVERLRYALQNAILTRDNHWAERDTLKKQVEEMKKSTIGFYDWMMTDGASFEFYEATLTHRKPTTEELFQEYLRTKSATYITDKQ